MDDGLSGIAKAIVEAGKSSVDFLGFALVAVLAVIVLVATRDVWLFFWAAVILSGVWIVLRYALYRVQTAERLRSITAGSAARAQNTLSKRVAEEEMRVIFKIEKKP